MSWWQILARRRARREHANGEANDAHEAVAAEAAKLREQEPKMRAARRDWRQVRETSDTLAQWIQDAMGGRGI